MIFLSEPKNVFMNIKDIRTKIYTFTQEDYIQFEKNLIGTEFKPGPYKKVTEVSGVSLFQDRKTGKISVTVEAPLMNPIDREHRIPVMFKFNQSPSKKDLLEIDKLVGETGNSYKIKPDGAVILKPQTI